MVFTKDEEDLISGKKASRGQPKTATQPHQNDQEQPDRHSQQLPSGPLELINQQRQDADAGLAGEIALVHQNSLQSIQSLAESAHLSAQKLAYQQALLIKSYPGLVSSYTNQFLGEFHELEARAANGFTNTVDFEKWAEELTQLALAPIAPSTKSLSPATPSGEA
jgi:hypothetical protein